MKPTLEDVLELLQRIDKISRNVPCMSAEVQKAFALRPELEKYRVELCRLIVSARELNSKAKLFVEVLKPSDNRHLLTPCETNYRADL